MASLLVADILTGSLAIFQRWGIYTRASGRPAILFDNVVGIEYKKHFDVSTYPLERGAFESYNKVEEPYDVRIRFSSGGSLSNRSALIQSIESIQDDLNLYAVVTPERTYLNSNITHLDYSRRDGKAGLLQVEVWLTEIRNTVQAALGDSPKGPSGSTDGSAAGSTSAPAVTDAKSGSAVSSESLGQVQATNALNNNQQGAANSVVNSGLSID